jgi:hypothetical protein
MAANRSIRLGMIRLTAEASLFFLDIEGPLHPFVRLGDVLPVLFRRVFKVRLLAIEQVQISHGIVVFRFDLDGPVQAVDALLQDRQIPGAQRLAHSRVLERAGIVRFHSHFRPRFRNVPGKLRVQAITPSV